MAYLTATLLKQEAAWWFTSWQPQITTSGAFDTWIATIVTRAANHVAWRVGTTNYASSNTLVQAILQEAELCVASQYLCLASATLADTSDPVPVAGDTQTRNDPKQGPSLRATAQAYEKRADRLLAPYDQYPPGNYRRPRAQAATTPAVDEIIPSFEETIEFEEQN